MLQFTVQTIKIYQAINKLFLRQGASIFPFYPGCNFHPSCSEYAIESLEKYGFKKGLFYSVSRIFKCHPWTKPRVDFP